MRSLSRLQKRDWAQRSRQSAAGQERLLQRSTTGLLKLKLERQQVPHSRSEAAG